jgi:hypothetical protein
MSYLPDLLCAGDYHVAACLSCFYLLVYLKKHLSMPKGGITGLVCPQEGEKNLKINFK